MIIRRTFLNIPFDDIWFEPDRAAISSAPITISRNYRYDASSNLCITEHTRCIDLSPSIEDIFSSFKPRARHSITSTLKKGVIRKADTTADHELFFRHYTSFARKRNLTIPSLSEATELDIFISESSDGEPLHGTAFITSPDRYAYRYRYSVAIGKSQSNAALLWTALCEAKKKGYRFFDLGGTTRGNLKNLSGVDFFKQQFGGVDRDFYIHIYAKARLLKILLKCAQVVLKNQNLYRGIVDRIVPVLRSQDKQKCL